MSRRDHCRKNYEWVVECTQRKKSAENGPWDEARREGRGERREEKLEVAVVVSACLLRSCRVAREEASYSRVQTS